MQHFVDKQALGKCRTPSSVAIGIFDGVHLGHQKLLSLCTKLATSQGLRSVVYTFDPHPACLFKPTAAPKLIEPLARRLERLNKLGLDAAWVQRFDQEFASTSAEAFVEQTLVATLQARHIVIGSGFCFGSKQQGNVDLLHKLGARHNFVVHPVELLHLDNEKVSSTRIRQQIASGDVLGAAKLLGRPFMLAGKVIHGAKRGVSLGFGTANIDTHEQELIPAIGVYAGFCRGPFGKRPCVTNVGYAPTFGDSAHVKVEVHLLDYAGDALYDAALEIDFLQLLRREQRFANVDALRAQIAADVAAARALLLT